LLVACECESEKHTTAPWPFPIATHIGDAHGLRCDGCEGAGDAHELAAAFPGSAVEFDDGDFPRHADGFFSVVLEGSRL
jgi:hypothetical protein